MLFSSPQNAQSSLSQTDKLLFCYSIVVPNLANKLRYQNTSKEKRQMHKHYENEFKRKIVQPHRRRQKYKKFI